MERQNLSVYYAKTSDSWFIEGYNDYITWLNEEDLKRFNMMKSVIKRNQFLLSRILIQKVATLITNELTTHYLINRYSELIINNNYSYSLSITHSGEIAAICICDEILEIGIDVEQMKKRNVLTLANEFCTDEEICFLKKTFNSLSNFYKLWTAKEALAKATQSNLYEIYSCNCSKVIANSKGSIQWNGEHFAFNNFEVCKYDSVTYIGSVIVKLQQEKIRLFHNKLPINTLWIYFST